MGNEMMGLEELAAYLQRDARSHEMVSRGHLPGHKVSGQWRFAKAEINHWIETQMHFYTEQELSSLEKEHGAAEAGQALISALMPEACVAVPLVASTKASVLKELVMLAENSWHLYDSEAILAAIRQREEMASTALTSGVAIPHPRRPLPAALGESVLAFGRTATSIAFGGDRGQMCDLFFLVCCKDDRTHLRVLARLSRLLLLPGFVDELRSAESPQETWQLLANAEADLLTP